MDYVGIGAEFYSNCGGAYTLDGYVVQKEHLPRYSQAPEPWRNENRDEMLCMTLRVDGKPDYTLVLPADEEYLDAVKAYLDIDVFADALLCDIRFKVPYIGELIRDTDCPAVEDYNDFAEALEDIWQQDGALLTYAAVLEAERPDISFLTTTTVDTLRFSKPIRKVTKNTKKRGGKIQNYVL